MKMKIKDTENIPIEQQLLVADGIELEDERAVSFYNIGNNSIIDLIAMSYESNMVVNPSGVATIEAPEAEPQE